MRQDRWFFAECLACLKHLYYLCAIQMDRYARGAAPMGCAHSTGRKPGRAGSSWFLSLRLRLAINVFSCIFSNGVMRNAPVSHKLMCRWSYPLYIPHRRSPPVTLIRTCLSNKAAGISSHLQTNTDIVAVLSPPEADEDGYRSCPLSTPWRRDEADSMQGGQACHGRVALMIKYFRTYVF